MLLLWKVVREWTEDSYEILQGCLEATDWNAHCEPHGGDTYRLTECITDYINFCVDCSVPAGTVHCYPNNKLWVTKAIKAESSIGQVQARLRQGPYCRDLRLQRATYRRNLSFQLQQE